MHGIWWEPVQMHCCTKLRPPCSHRPHTPTNPPRRNQDGRPARERRRPPSRRLIPQRSTSTTEDDRPLARRPPLRRVHGPSITPATSAWAEPVVERAHVPRRRRRRRRQSHPGRLPLPSDSRLAEWRTRRKQSTRPLPSNFSSSYSTSTSSSPPPIPRPPLPLLFSPFKRKVPSSLWLATRPLLARELALLAQSARGTRTATVGRGARRASACMSQSAFGCGGRVEREGKRGREELGESCKSPPPPLSFPLVRYRRLSIDSLVASHKSTTQVALCQKVRLPLKLPSDPPRR